MTAFAFEIGAIVVPRARLISLHDRWIGQIIAREIYEGPAGSRDWYYVRWIAPDGRPAEETQRVSSLEIELDGEPANVG